MKRYEANIPRGGPVETGTRRDFPVNARAGARSGARISVRCDLRLAAPLGAFLAIPYLGNVLVHGAEAHWAPVAAAAGLAVLCRSRRHHQPRRAN
ncbi:hypothetical protein ADL22_06320 [Streptomyces sp. NRRL F-4489]|uniref:hypothetical protein n=1 Tax=Streptomyces sp. NRRL F-4489 TaxID=1609095 RepID=UPI00074A7AA2|nr:hypothetical protein [Streptomyces sp. NRRL F-4489]KUL51408.1 hypothetical protein ADL22_06320 [Streptomyces sp. NRRL F-4489]